MAVKEKQCEKCHLGYEKLYRCSLEKSKWIFICAKCLQEVKKNHSNSYVYGGTWKSRK
tara:strand:- start:637 stop:810 length:174 start_codon:yes stop_codon:yes gene_type:complete